MSSYGAISKWPSGKWLPRSQKWMKKNSDKFHSPSDMLLRRFGGFRDHSDQSSLWKFNSPKNCSGGSPYQSFLRYEIENRLRLYRLELLHEKFEGDVWPTIFIKRVHILVFDCEESFAINSIKDGSNPSYDLCQLLRYQPSQDPTGGRLSLEFLISQSKTFSSTARKHCWRWKFFDKSKMPFIQREVRANHNLMCLYI